jgi:hypothetical protein
VATRTGSGHWLSILYLPGSTLVEFTGNKSIVPMLHRASNLGVISADQKVKILF